MNDRSRLLSLVGAWIAVSVLAETVAAGFAAVTIATTAAGVMVAALLEGTLLGFGQQRLLRPLGLGLERGWVPATIAGMLIARVIEFGADGSIAAMAASAWNLGEQIGAGAALGAFAGAVMALPQCLVLRGRIAGWPLWIAARAVAWGVGLPLLMFAATIVARASGAPRLELFGMVLAVFAVLAAVVGAIEGFAMERLVARTPHRATAAVRA